MKKINYDEINLKSDQHVFHMWEPLNFKIKDNYKFVISNIFLKIISNVICIIIYPILWAINKALFGFKIINKENITKAKCGKITISNHIHPMDCTMVGLINFPSRTYYPTLVNNFKIPFIRHLIRILYAMPIPSKKNQKQRFISEINKLLKNGKTLHMYPEGSLWPYYEDIREFKIGAFKMAIDANVPIIPIKYIFTKPQGIYKIYKKKKCINTIVLNPIYPNTNLNRTDRIENLRKRVIEAMRA